MSAGDPSGASPAPLAPANSLVYLELTLRPQGTQRATVESSSTCLLGHSPDAAFGHWVGKLFAHLGLSYGSEIEPWLGQRVGLVVTKLSPDGLALIAPTTAPSAALKAFRAALHVRLQSASYAGIHYQECVDPAKRLALGIVGHNAVLAAPTVFKEIVDAFHGRRSLADTAKFRSAFSSVPGTPLIRAYVNATAVGSDLHTLLGALPSGRIPSSIQQLYGTALAKLHGTVGISLNAAPRALTVDIHSSVPHPGGSGADVGALPEQSWFALATGTLNLQPLERVLRSEVGRNPALELAFYGCGPSLVWTCCMTSCRPSVRFSCPSRARRRSPWRAAW